MLGWASQQFEKLSQTVAPPPADANGRFVYAVQRGDEDGAMACVGEMDPARAVLNPTKRTYAIHLACENSMDRLIRLLLTQPGVDLTFIDTHGNTPLHYAAMSTDRGRALPTIKMLVTEFKASVVAKNSVGQTPYDLATLDMIRQFLLPLQLQEETRQAIDNGGVGLPPGIDMGGLRIANPAAPPPPIMPHAPAPMSSPAPHAYQHDPPKPPTSGQGSSSGYARTGGSSLAIYKKYADGFHSSSSDVGLQQKYGHTQLQYGNIAPPPSSGNAVGSANPYAGGNNPYASGRANQRYVAYDAVTGQTTSMPRSVASPPAYGQPAAAATTPINYAVFQPGGTTPAATPVPTPYAYNPASSTTPATATSGYAASQPYQSPSPHLQTYPAAPNAYGGNVPAATTPVAPHQQQGYAYGQQQAQPAQHANAPGFAGATSPNVPPSPAQQGYSTYGPQGRGVQGFQQPATPATVTSAKSPIPTGSGGGFSPTKKADPNAAANLFSSPASGGLAGGLSPTPANAAPIEQASSVFCSPPAAQTPAGSVVNTLPESVVPSGPGNPTNDAHPGSQLTPLQSSGHSATTAAVQSAASVFGAQPEKVIQPAPTDPASNNVPASTNGTLAQAPKAVASAVFGQPLSSEALPGGTQAAPAQPIEPGSDVAASSSATSASGGPPSIQGTIGEGTLEGGTTAQVTSGGNATSTLSTSAAFGAPPTSSQAHPAQSAAGVFGAPPVATQSAPIEPAPGAAAATSVFGAPPNGIQAQPVESASGETGSFGAPPDTTQSAPIEPASTAPSTTSIFGAPPTSSQPQPVHTATGVFGAPPGATQTAPIQPFGAPPTSSEPQPAQSATGVFGAPPGATQTAPIQPAGAAQSATNIFGALPASSQAPVFQGHFGSSAQPVAAVFNAPAGNQPGGAEPMPVSGAPTASSVFDARPGSISSPVVPGSGVASQSGSTSPFPVAPTSGGFSLAEQAANFTAASNLFASPPSQGQGSNTTPALQASNGLVSPVQPSQADAKGVESQAAPAPVQEPSSVVPQIERSGSPAGSDEGLDDVPLSPEVQHQAAVAIGQNGGQPAGTAGFPPPPVGQMQAPAGPAATPGSESLFAAIGMPPPPFSSKR